MATTHVWTRRELRNQMGFDDAQIDQVLEEVAQAAANHGRVSPIDTVGEGDDQLFKLNDHFARAIGLL